MVPYSDLPELLGIDDLRRRFLEHTRSAFALLPAMPHPRILDVGCGSGLPTVQLARMADGEVVGIDTDAKALGAFNERVRARGLQHRVRGICVSLSDNEFPDASFGVIWGEGVFHLLDPVESFAECRRLLKAGGFLVMHETRACLENTSAEAARCGLRLFDEHALPPGFWWDAYGAPLEDRIARLRHDLGGAPEPPGLDEYDAQVEWIRSSAESLDCRFRVLRKEGL